MRHILFFYLFLLVVVSCSVDVPGDVISPGKMERILYDYHRAQGMAAVSNGDADVNRFVFVQQVFRKYGITEAEFDSSMVWYSGHSGYLVKIYKNIDERLQREAEVLGLETTNDIYANLTAYGDTAVVWSSTNVCMHNARGRNIVTYKIIPDSSFLLGDTYALRFKNRFVMQDGQKEGYALLIARFENDSVAAVTTHVAGDFDSSINIAQSLLTDTARLSQLQVVFYYPYHEADMDKFQLWMVNSPMLVRFHHAGSDRSEQAVEEADTVASVSADTLGGVRERGGRLTPQQLRDSHEGERTINVTKQRKVALPPSNRSKNAKRR